jgi:colanic acid/amylovoran biosynthesis protein
MKNKIQNILISNIYSWKNKGDAAIVISMLDDIKNQYPNAKLTLSTLDKEDAQIYGKYEYRLNTYLYVVKINDSKFYLLSKIIFFLFRVKIFEICSKLGFKPYFLFSNLLSQKIREYNDFDLVVACGGGYLLTRSNGGIFPLLVTAYDFYFAKLFKKPYILYNQSIGPLYKKWQFKLIKPFLGDAKKLILREDVSFKRLNEYNLSNIVLSSDIAFNLGVQSNNILKKYSFSEANVNFGLTVRNWLPEDRQKKYEEEIAKFIETVLSEEEKALFYFIPQVIYADMGDDDLVTSRKIFDIISEEYKSRVVIIDMDLHPEKLKYIISQMNYFIGTRMHSNIFALSSLVKTIAIAYEPKTTGIMRMLNLSDYVIQMEDVDRDKLYKLFLKIKLDSRYLMKLSEQLKYVKNISTNNLSDFF